MRIAIYGKTNSHELSGILKDLIVFLQKNNCRILINKFLYDIIIAQLPAKSDIYVYNDKQKIAEDVDLLLSIGGDGTLLDTVALVSGTQIPVLGINLGRLGFIASVPPEQMEYALNEIINSNYQVKPRTLLTAKTMHSDIGVFNMALNEIAIQKKDSSSMITIHTYVNGEFLNSYWADGIIIATPTGSTAYSLSCGGPILTPDSKTIIITPIAPHNLAVRPVVIPEDSLITMKISGRSAGYWISLDSRYHPGEPGDEIMVCTTEFKMNFIELEKNNFFTALRNKLLWGRDTRN